MTNTSFAALKKNRSKAFDKLNQQLENISSKAYVNPDEGKYWKPTRDQAGNGFAIIRFLPEPEGEDYTFVRIWDHAFQGPTGLWYIENSRTTLGRDVPDPVSEYNTKLYNSTTDKDAPERKQASKQKRKLHFVSNIYVVKDSGNPENEGKVFLYKYGKKIFDMLNDLMKPSFEDEKPVNPFDLWEGANFRLKIRSGDGGFPNYDKSEFDSPSALFDDEEKMERVWKQCYSLNEVVDPKQFKSYDELKAKLDRVLGLSTPSNNFTSRAEVVGEAVDEDIDMSVLASQRSTKMAKPLPSADIDIDVDDDDADSLEYFKNLAARV